MNHTLCSLSVWHLVCFYFTGLTTWTCLSPRTTLLMTITWPFLLLFLYVVLDKESLKREQSIAEENAGVVEEDEKGHITISFSNKVTIAKDIFPFILFLFVTYFSEYLSNHAIITTLGFPNAPFAPRDHYPYYILCYHVGKFLGRSHMFIISAINPIIISYVHVKRTWVLALIVFLHGIFFLLASWFRFVPRVEIILALCFTEGFTAGSMYLNSALTVSGQITDPEGREFALCLLTVGNACGKLTAGLLGLFQEPFLRRHCYEDLGLGYYCLTRHEHRAAWTRNVNC